MSQTIYKYTLRPEESVIELPPLVDAAGHARSLKDQLLRVDEQQGNIVLWALVTPERPPRKVRFQVYMTGEPCDGRKPEEYIATVLLLNERYVLHVFMWEEATERAISV